KPLQLLAALLERPGELVTRKELKQRLWSSDTFVDFDLSLNKAMNRLREALRDSADQPRYIETLPKRGYRFIKSVDSIGTDAQESVAPRTVLPSSDHRLGERLPFKLLISIAVGMFVALLTVLVGVR